MISQSYKSYPSNSHHLLSLRGLFLLFFPPKRRILKAEMAATFFALTNTFFPPLHSSSSLSLPKTTLLTFFKHNSKRPNSSPVLLCKAAFDPSRRQSLAIYFSAFVLSLPGKGLFSDSNANAAILEADDDEELLEKVKKDRKKRIQRQEVINSSKKETGLASFAFL